MDIKQIKEFIALSKTLNYSQASQECFISQPVLSRHIMALESELGCQLFVRSHRDVHLTDCGQIFFAYAKNIAAEYDKAITEIQRAVLQYSGSLRVSYIFDVLYQQISKCAESFYKKYPSVNLLMDSIDFMSVSAVMETYHSDIVCTYITEPLPMNEYNYRILFSDFMEVIVRDDHPLANRDSVSFSDLKEEQFIGSFPSKHATYAPTMIELINSNGGSAHLTEYATGYRHSLILIEENRGITIAPGASGVTIFSICALSLWSETRKKRTLIWQRSGAETI